MAAEAALLRRGPARGVPVAEVVVAAGDAAAEAAGVDLGPPWMVMRRIEGETVPRRIFRDDALAAARAAMTAPVRSRAGRDPSHPAPPGRRGSMPPTASLGSASCSISSASRTRRSSSGCAGSRPTGLRIGRPDGGARRLPHRQPHGRPGRAAGGARLGARPPRRPDGGPRLVLRAGVALRLRAARRRRSDREELVDAYEAAGGARRSTPTRCAGGRCWARSRWGVICIMQARAHLHRPVPVGRAGRHRPPGLRERARPADAAAVTATAPARRADVAELVEAVREFLEGDVMPPPSGRCSSTPGSRSTCWPWSSGSWRGPGPGAAHAERLAALGVADDAELAAAIRAR